MLRALRSIALGTTLLALAACDKDEPAAADPAPAATPEDAADGKAAAQEPAEAPPRQPLEFDDPREMPNEGKAVAERRASLQLDRCLEGGCKQACEADAERCRLSCSGGRCEQTGIGPSANLGCRGGSCTQTCEGEGEGGCRMTCVDGKCTQLCKSGDCSLSCYGGGCTQTCEAGSTCELECEGRGCKQSCDGATSCKKK